MSDLDFPPDDEAWVNVALGDDLVSATVQIGLPDDEFATAQMELPQFEDFVGRAQEILRLMRYNCADWVYFRLPGQRLHVHRKGYFGVTLRRSNEPVTLDRPICGQVTPEQEGVGWRLAGCLGEPEGRDLCGNCLKLWRRSVASLASEAPDA